MGLDIDLVKKGWFTRDKVNFEETSETVYDCNITHNLGEMAGEAGIYEALWRPYRLAADYTDFGDDYDAEMEFAGKQTIVALDIIPHIRIGLLRLKSNPDHYKKFNSPNGWGTYEHFVPFVENYLNALLENPHAIVQVSR